MGDGNQVFYTNLLLLGFNPVIMEAKYQMKFKKDMFLKPNKKAFEVISHFLFSKLDAALCKEKFRSCWPIYDKKQEQEFRKTCCNWIKDISIECSEARFPRIVPSLFLSPGGDKFMALYFSFSRYVLWKVIIRDFGCKHLLCSSMPSFSQDYASIVRTILEISTDKAIQNFLKIQKTSQDLHNIWHIYARDLVATNRLLNKRINDKKELLRQKKEILITRSRNSQEYLDKISETLLEQEFVNRERMRKVSKMWQNIEEFQNREEMYWDILSSIVDDGKHMTLEGGSMDFHISDTFLQHCKDNLLEKGVTKICKNGKVDINSVLQMWNVCLKFQHDMLMEANLPDSESWLKSVKSHVEDHCINLDILQKLSSKLNLELIPLIKASLSRISKTTIIKNSDTDTTVGLNIQDKIFELCPFTPDIALLPLDANEQPIVPRRIFSLSPVIGLSNGISGKGQKYVRSPLLTDPIATPKTNEIDKNDFRITPVIQLEQIGKKQRTKVIWAVDEKVASDQPSTKSCTVTKGCDVSCETNIINNLENEESNAMESQLSLDNKDAGNESSIAYAVASMDTGGNKNVSVTAVSENVKAKFVEMIVDSVIDETAEDSLTSLPCESVSSSTLDLYEQTAFVTRDKLARTPLFEIKDNASTTESILDTTKTPVTNTASSKVAKSLESSINEMQTIFEIICSPKQEELQLDSFTLDPNLCQHTLLDLLWDTEEELLTKVTLPSAPFFSATNEGSQENLKTVKNSSKKDLDIIDDDILNLTAEEDNSFTDLLKGYNDLKKEKNFKSVMLEQ